ncbi:MAG: hypothetical protein KGL39_10685 [Patescibacteria group bacterium]|nr:hypothetical protein [Patescibacteria group bacterium]
MTPRQRADRAWHDRPVGATRKTIIDRIEAEIKGAVKEGREACAKEVEMIPETDREAGLAWSVWPFLHAAKVLREGLEITP